ncbi:hypothetical protein IMZ48_04315 [Candidatus Bathyarchaeota archaeon]|nr:hypothetical protein [Candidatus Bathyarchaeota archaeon]
MASQDAPVPDEGGDATPVCSSCQNLARSLDTPSTAMDKQPRETLTRRHQIEKVGEKATDNGHAKDAHHHAPATFKLDLEDALTPDPGTEDMFHAENNKFAFSPGQLSKLLNPKNLSAFYALGGLGGLEMGLRTDKKSGLGVDEVRLDGSVTFEQVAAKGASPYGAFGNAMPTLKEGAKASVHIPPAEPVKDTDSFADRKRNFRDNTLPEKKPRSIFQLAWIAYNDKVLMLLTAAAIVSLALGLYQTFAPQESAEEEEEPKIEWVEGVAILVAIM